MAPENDPSLYPPYLSIMFLALLLTRGPGHCNFCQFVLFFMYEVFMLTEDSIHLIIFIHSYD